MNGQPDTDTDALRELVRAHHVVYEVRVAEEMVADHRTKVGFDVVLCGTDGADDAINISEAEGAVVWCDLRLIAIAILPPAGSHSVLGVKSFDHGVHCAPMRDYRDDVELVIGIRPEPGAVDSLAHWEEQSLKSVVAALRALGVQAEKWKKLPPVQTH